MIAVTLCAFLAAAGPVSDEPSVNALSDEPMLLLDLKSSGLPEKEVAALNSLVGQSISRLRPKGLITGEDVRRAVDVEQQKQMAGCGDSSCLLNLAGAFGARYIVYGNLALIGKTYIVQLTLYDADKTNVVNRSKETTQNIDELSKKIDGAVDRLFALETKNSEPLADEQGSILPLALTGTGAAITLVGGAALAFGVGGLGGHAEKLETLSAAENAFRNASTDAERNSAREDGNRIRAEAQDEGSLLNTAIVAGSALAVLGLATLGSGAFLWMGE